MSIHLNERTIGFLETLIDRLAVEKILSESEAVRERKQGFTDADLWLETAGYENIKAVGNLPRRHIDVFGASDSWTNDDLRKLDVPPFALRTNDRVSGFVGRVKSVWNEIAKSKLV
jgi:hypothetical protein